YKSMMLSDVPNFAFAIGYTNASWTLKVDLVCEHFCRLLAHMDQCDAEVVIPVRADRQIERRPVFNLTSGYVRRGSHLFPHAGTSVCAPMRVASDTASLTSRLPAMSCCSRKYVRPLTGSSAMPMRRGSSAASSSSPATVSPAW